MNEKLEEEIREAINRNSAKSGSDTPDFKPAAPKPKTVEYRPVDGEMIDAENAGGQISDCENL